MATTKARTVLFSVEVLSVLSVLFVAPATAGDMNATAKAKNRIVPFMKEIPVPAR